MNTSTSTSTSISATAPVLDDEALEKLKDFQRRVAEARAREAKIVAWHLRMYTEGGLDLLPYRGDETYINVNVEDYVRDEVTNEYKTVYDEAATLERLRKIAKFASSVSGAKVTKEYRDDFELRVELPSDPSSSISGSTGTHDPKVTVRYCVNRDTVCTKKVVGTKVIPAYTSPERVEEVVEWNCEKISLLAPAPAPAPAD